MAIAVGWHAVSGKIVLITGTSGSGKSTTCATFARRAVEPYLMFGMDLLVGTLFPAKYTNFGEKKEEGYQPTQYGPMCMKALEAMHEMVAAAARTGQNMVVDHLMFLDPPVLQDCIWRLKDVDVWFICLKPDRDEIQRRLSERTFELPAPMIESMGVSGPEAIRIMNESLAAVTPWFFEHSYQNDCYDLVLDSASMSPDEVCERIEQRVAEGPGTAFETLRTRYPQR